MGILSSSALLMTSDCVNSFSSFPNLWIKQPNTTTTPEFKMGKGHKQILFMKFQKGLFCLCPHSLGTPQSLWDSPLLPYTIPLCLYSLWTLKILMVGPAFPSPVDLLNSPHNSSPFLSVSPQNLETISTQEPRWPHLSGTQRFFTTLYKKSRRRQKTKNRTPTRQRQDQISTPRINSLPTQTPHKITIISRTISLHQSLMLLKHKTRALNRHCEYV